MAGIRRPLTQQALIFLAVLVFACRFVCGTESVEGLAPRVGDEFVFPVGEQLSYAVSWMGIHCGEVEITSSVDTEVIGGPVYHFVGLARTTRFFDGIYRLRSRVDSFFDPRRITSIRFEEHSLVKKKRKEEVWLVDHEAKEVVRTNNGEETRIPIEVEQGNDPLAFIARLRTMDKKVGQEHVLGLMTTKGVIEMVARVTRTKEIKTKMGKCDAVAVIPKPRDEKMFPKAGSMVVWIDRVEPHRPCKIEFDLSFGKLAVSLKRVGIAPEGDVGAGWENWGDSKERSR